MYICSMQKVFKTLANEIALQSYGPHALAIPDPLLVDVFET